MTYTAAQSLAQAGKSVISIAGVLWGVDFKEVPTTHATSSGDGASLRGTIHIRSATDNPEAIAALTEEPSLKWFVTFSHNNFSRAQISGSGLIAAVQYLLSEGHVKLQDRRETIAIGTVAGVKDALLGLHSISVDLGRWRLVQQDIEDGMVKIDLAGRHLVITAEKFESLDSLACYQNTDIENIIVLHEHGINNNGIGELVASSYNPATLEVQGGVSTAAAAALGARHLCGKNLPHHWRVKLSEHVVSTRMFATEEGEHVSVSATAVNLAEIASVTV